LRWGNERRKIEIVFSDVLPSLIVGLLKTAENIESFFFAVAFFPWRCLPAAAYSSRLAVA